jgi:S1-C subfamily serine protease
VTALDWIIVVLTLLAAAAGYLQGFLVGVATLAGFAAGLVLGGRLGTALVEGGSRSPYAPLFGLLGALLGGLVLGAALETVGHGVRRRVRLPGLAVADGVGGAALAGAVALGLAWLTGSVALQTPGVRASLRDEVQHSAVLRSLNALLPPSGPILNALARFDPVPRIDGPPARVRAPRAAVARDPEVAGARAGVVRVRGTACGLSVTGSGWIAGDGVVVTNAHVVAGQDDTTIEPGGDDRSLDAQAFAFDSRNDVAVLHVPGLDGRALPLAADPTPGTSAGILGFPENGPFQVRAGRLGATATVLTQDAYGRGRFRRQLTSLRGRVLPGNSGGPLVDTRGRVVTTVFAATRGGPAGGYGVPNAIVRRALERARRPVGTGPCAR